MKLEGPFKIKPGPIPRILCEWCDRPVSLRSGELNTIHILICTRQECKRTRFQKHPYSKTYDGEIAAQIITFGE